MSKLNDFFITLLFKKKKSNGDIDWEPKEGALKLQKWLEGQGYSVFLCDVDSGGDIFQIVSEAMDNAKMFIVFGSKTYGFKTDSKCSTYQELSFIFDEKKPFFLFKMCNKYSVSTTKTLLSRGIAYDEWYPFQNLQLPLASCENIIKKYTSLFGAKQVCCLFIFFSCILQTNAALLNAP